MEIYPLDIVIHIINISVFYVLLRILLYTPIAGFMKKRSAGIQQELDTAAKKQEEAAGLLAAYNKQLSAAKSDAEKLVQDERLKATTAASEIISNAQKEAEQILAAARIRAEKEYRENSAHIEHQIADMAVSLAGEILAREVGVEDNERIIDAFFHKAV